MTLRYLRTIVVGLSRVGQFISTSCALLSLSTRTRGKKMESIRQYEMMVLADPNVDESKINILFDKLADLGGKLGAKLVNRSLWGKRRLAYEIKDLKEGVYYILDIESVPSAVSKLESYLKIQNEVLRFLTIVKGERTEEQLQTEQISETDA